MKLRILLGSLIVTCFMLIANPLFAKSDSDTDTAGGQEDQGQLLNVKNLKDKLTVKGLSAEDLKDTMLSVLPKEKSALNAVLENLKGRIPDEKLAELEDKLPSLIRLAFHETPHLIRLSLINFRYDYFSIFSML